MDLAKVVVAALLHIVFALGLAAGGWAVWEVDHRPAIDFTVPAPARWLLPDAWKHVHIEGLSAQRDAALSDAAAARAELAALKAKAKAQLAQAEQNSAAARAEAQRAHAAGRPVLTLRRQSDPACAFAARVDQAFLKGLGQ